MADAEVPMIRHGAGRRELLARKGVESLDVGFCKRHAECCCGVVSRCSWKENAGEIIVKFRCCGVVPQSRYLSLPLSHCSKAALDLDAWRGVAVPLGIPIGFCSQGTSVERHCASKLGLELSPCWALSVFCTSPSFVLSCGVRRSSTICKVDLLVPEQAVRAPSQIDPSFGVLRNPRLHRYILRHFHSTKGHAISVGRCRKRSKSAPRVTSTACSALTAM